MFEWEQHKGISKYTQTATTVRTYVHGVRISAEQESLKKNKIAFFRK